MQDKSTKVWEEGYDARFAGIPRSANPYQVGLLSQDRYDGAAWDTAEMWQSGWDDADGFFE